jgi:tripartite-type tricarboxylate transporter receptor subunit TctC
LADFIEAARAKPGETTVGGAGAATAKHVGVQMIARAAKVELTYVPFTGGAPALNALLGSHVAAVYTEYAPVAGHIREGTLRLLATTSKARIPQMPDVPTVAESGYKDFEVDLWWGTFAPARTPKATVEQLGNGFTAALQSPALKGKLDALGFSPVGLCGEGFGALLKKQYESYGQIVRESSLTAQ